MTIETQPPQHVTSSALWQRLSSRPELQHAVQHLRLIAGTLAQEAARVVPGFTDHSVQHMDALWNVASQILKPDEMSSLAPGEAFILASAFYIHDLGMAYAATEDGVFELRASEEYLGAFSRAQRVQNLETEQADRIALQITTRKLHAKKAEKLTLEPLPGLDRYLIESTDLRRQWGTFIGEVSASHHWSMNAVHNKLGMRGKIPDSLGEELDLAYVACVLRIVDYAHINFQRAPQLDRLLRSEMPDDSLVHWNAQEHIAGPRRQEDKLVFSSLRPIDSVDAWWLFYEMATGLDQEIGTVKEYLSGRIESQDRFSLVGVKEVRTPQAFGKLVRPSGFDPVDVRFRPESIDRLVEILGSKTLYGNDQFAPLRELLQNARDAIDLRRSAERVAGQPPEVGEITVEVQERDGNTYLSVADSGVGMSNDVVTNYLLGIASDYWNSLDFFSAYPGVAEQGFKPVGRFGIGFLSVFMIGDDVKVETKREGRQGIRVSLKGVGRRGALQSDNTIVRSGTRVTAKVTKQAGNIYEQIAVVATSRAPMLKHRLTVVRNGTIEHIEPGWWKRCSQQHFLSFVLEWHKNAYGSQPNIRNDYGEMMIETHQMREFLHWELKRDQQSQDYWGGSQPEIQSDNYRVLGLPSSGGHVILCSKGIAVNSIPMQGLVGVIDVDQVDVNAARTTPLDFDRSEYIARLTAALRPEVIKALDAKKESPSIPSQYRTLCSIADNYGREVLLATELPWITVIRPPGNATLNSPTAARREIETLNHVAVTFGVGPWAAWKYVQEEHPSFPADGLIITVPSWNQPRFGTYRDEARVTAPLGEHFATERDPKDWQDAHLLAAVIDLIGEAWDKTPELLAAANWTRDKDNWLLAVCAKSDD